MNPSVPPPTQPAAPGGFTAPPVPSPETRVAAVLSVLAGTMSATEAARNLNVPERVFWEWVETSRHQLMSTVNSGTAPLNTGDRGPQLPSTHTLSVEEYRHWVEEQIVSKFWKRLLRVFTPIGLGGFLALLSGITYWTRNTKQDIAEAANRRMDSNIQQQAAELKGSFATNAVRLEDEIRKSVEGDVAKLLIEHTGLVSRITVDVQEEVQKRFNTNTVQRIAGDLVSDYITNSLSRDLRTLFATDLALRQQMAGAVTVALRSQGEIDVLLRNAIARAYQESKDADQKLGVLQFLGMFGASPQLWDITSAIITNWVHETPDSLEAALTAFRTSGRPQDDSRVVDAAVRSLTNYASLPLGRMSYIAFFQRLPSEYASNLVELAISATQPETRSLYVDGIGGMISDSADPIVPFNALVALSKSTTAGIADPAWFALARIDSKQPVLDTNRMELIRAGWDLVRSDPMLINHLSEAASASSSGLDGLDPDFIDWTDGGLGPRRNRRPGGMQGGVAGLRRSALREPGRLAASEEGSSPSANGASPRSVAHACLNLIRLEDWQSLASQGSRSLLPRPMAQESRIAANLVNLFAARLKLELRTAGRSPGTSASAMVTNILSTLREADTNFVLIPAIAEAIQPLIPHLPAPWVRIIAADLSSAPTQGASTAGRDGDGWWHLMLSALLKRDAEIDPPFQCTGELIQRITAASIPQRTELLFNALAQAHSVSNESDEAQGLQALAKLATRAQMVDTNAAVALELLDLITQDKYLKSPTLPEVLEDSNAHIAADSLVRSFAHDEARRRRSEAVLDRIHGLLPWIRQDVGARPLSLGDSIDLAWSHQTPQRWFSFPARTNTHYFLSMEGPSVEVLLVRGRGREVLQRQTGSDVMRFYPADVSGEALLRLKPADLEDSGEGRLHFWSEMAIELGRDRTEARPISVPASNVVTLGGEGQGWFRFAAELGWRYRFATHEVMDRSESTLDPAIKLYHGRGDPLAEDDDGGAGLNALLEWDCNQGGEYHVEVSNLRQAAAGSLLRLSVDAIQLPPAQRRLVLSSVDGSPTRVPPREVVALDLAPSEPWGWISVRGEPDAVYLLQASSSILAAEGQAGTQRQVPSAEAGDFMPFWYLLKSDPDEDQRFRVQRGTYLSLFDLQARAAGASAGDAPLLRPTPITATNAHVFHLSPGTNVVRLFGTAGVSNMIRIVPLDSSAEWMAAFAEPTVEDDGERWGSGAHGEVVWVPSRDGEHALRINSLEAGACVVWFGPYVPQSLITRGSTKYHGLRVGDRVVLGEHVNVKGAKNWAAEMAKYVGRLATITSLTEEPDTSNMFTARVDVDKGQWMWRIANMKAVNPSIVRTALQP